MRHTAHRIISHWPLVLLALAEVILFSTNYAPNTYVVGWDNMFPEFNFPLNIHRALYGIWQEYRGLGLVDGLSHAAQLPHYLFLWLLSLVFPEQLLRYLYIFAMHLVGGFGMYTLLHTSVFKHPKSLQNTLIASCGALFYQYNFATIQMFFLPFEVFMTHFAFLPWLVWVVMQYMDHGSRMSLVWFGILSLISTPQAHVPTVFLVYLMILGSIVISKSIIHHTAQTLKRASIIVLFTFLINAFWGIPFAYATLFHAHEIAQSKNNQIATNDIYLKNQRYGDLANTALMRSFSLDYVQYDHTIKLQSYMFAPWKKHIDTPAPALAGGVFFSLAVIGACLVLIRRRTDLYIYVLLFLFSFAIIGNDIPYVSLFSKTLREYIPLFHNVFRFVFTKFFTLYAFAYSILLSIALLEIVHATAHARRRDSIITGIVFGGLLFWYALPSFQGNFFYKNLRVPIPQAYTDTFTYLATQPKDARVAVLPAPWFWAWTQYDWGVIGSGFQWFGIPQPILDRAFDPWSRMNENFYWELTQALYTKNTQNIKNVLNKYDVQILLLDEHIINGSDSRALYLDEIKQWVASDPSVKQIFSSGKISLYSIATQEPIQDFVSSFSTLQNIGPATMWSDSDMAYNRQGTYMTTATKDFDTFFPVRSLFSGRSQRDIEYTVEETDTAVLFKGKTPQQTGMTLRIPAYDATEVPTDSPASLTAFMDQLPIVSVGSQFSAAQLPDTQNATFLSQPSDTTDMYIQKTADTRVYDSDTTSDLRQQPKSCDGFNTGHYTHTYSEAPNQYLRLTSVHSSNCISIDLSNLSHRYAYLIAISHRPIEGKVLSFSLTNKDSRRSFIETVLTPKKPRTANTVEFETAWITVPPLDMYGLGYTLTLDNVSIGRERSINDLKNISIYKIPYELLTRIHYTADENSSVATASSQLDVESVEHPNPSLYRVTIAPKNTTQTLVLSQSFDHGWIALTSTKSFPYVKLVGTHVLVNNWKNGWTDLPADTKTIYLFFWPQLLQWFGFLLLPLPFLIARRMHTHS